MTRIPLYILLAITSAMLLAAGFTLNAHRASAQAVLTTTAIVVENKTSRFTLNKSLAESWSKYVALPSRSVIQRLPLTTQALQNFYLTGNDGADQSFGIDSPAQKQSNQSGQLSSDNQTSKSQNVYAGQSGQVIYHYDPEKIYAWVTALAPDLAAAPQEPILDLEIGIGKIINFQPPLPGQVLDARQTTLNILAALESNQNIAELAVHSTPPKIQLASTNNLGINELVGRGESNFKGSPKNRIHNIKAGIEKLKGAIIAPGAEFSFNKNICPVDVSGGYLPELVILASGTTPEYGGGLCQVSSTLFRAVMDTGLPVTLRKNHSYAVQYYAPQGSDATTYCGGIDLKFKNDTPGSILIWPYMKEGSTILTFDFYGSKDGRQVTLEAPVQYDRQADGAMKAYWNRTVTLADGEVRKDSFKSTYLPPALFHKPPPEATTPSTTAPPTDGTTPPGASSGAAPPGTSPPTTQPPGGDGTAPSTTPPGTLPLDTTSLAPPAAAAPTASLTQ